MTHLANIIVLTTAIIVVGFTIFEILFVTLSGSPIAAPTIPRDEQTLGSGQPLRYIIMGDSTTIAQGGEYSKGYAVATAQFLARDYAVTWKNVGISGARAAQILTEQLPNALRFKPDIVLLAVGANDVVHLTNNNTVRASLDKTIAALQTQNSSVRIILTGAPDMGSVPRFPWPIKQLAGRRTVAINTIIAQLARERHITFAPIAAETGHMYRAHPELFAADKFHPTSEGYQPWVPVLLEAICASGDDARAGY